MKRLTTLFLCILLTGCSVPGIEATKSKQSVSQLEDRKTIAETSTSTPAEAPNLITQEVTETESKIDSKTSSAQAKTELLDEITALNSNLDKTKGKDKEVRKNSIATNLDESEADQVVATALETHKPKVNLKSLRYFEAQINKKVLLPLSSPTAIKYVRELNLAELHLTDDDLEPIANLRLELLDLCGNNLSDLRALKKMTTLKTLDVSGSPLKPQAYKQLSQLSKMQRLSLSNTPTTDEDLKLLSNLSNLKLVQLGGCKITYKPLKAFIDATHNKCMIESVENNVPVPKILMFMDKTIEDKKYAEAEIAIGRHLKEWREKSPPDYDALCQAYIMLGRCEAALKRKKEALAAYNHFYELFLHDHPSKLSLWDADDGFEEYVSCLQFYGEWDKALQLRLDREKIAISELANVQSLRRHWQVGRAYNYLGIANCYAHFGQFENALKNYAKAADGFEIYSDEYGCGGIDAYIGEARAFKSKKDSINSKKYCIKARQLIRDDAREKDSYRLKDLSHSVDQLEK
jgi:tetratricopeptide (TPR) repeat protein